MSLGQKIDISWIWDNHTGYIMHPFEIYVSLCRSVQSRVPSYIGTEHLILLPLYLAQIQYVYLPTEWPLYSPIRTSFGASSRQSSSLVARVIEWTNPAAPTANITTQIRLPWRISDWIESEKPDVAIAGEIDEGIATTMVERPGRSQEL